MGARDLILRLRALVAPRRVDRELDEELAFHIDCETRKQIDAGLSPADARRRALARFGPVPLAADQCRDARGIGVVDTVTRDVLYALRTFRRAPLAAFTIVATVGLGLGLVAVVFTVYNLLFLRTDAVRNPGDLYSIALERHTGGDDPAPLRLTRQDYEAMRRETVAFADAAAILDPGGPSYIDGRLARGIFVSGNFFQMLGVQAALGRPLRTDDDERFATPAAIALSHAGWQKLFDGDPRVIGRRVEIGRVPHEIVGVMPDGFRGLGITPPDYWAPLVGAGEAATSRADAADTSLDVVGRLKPGVSRAAAAAELSAWASAHAGFEPSPARPVNVSLTPNQGTLTADGFGVVFAPLFFAFGLILLIGCANVANLLLARGVSRQKEIGIRLSLGASRGRIVRQLLTESLLLALAAAGVGLIVAWLSLEGLLRGLMRALPPEILQFVSVFNLTVPAADWRLVLFLLGGAIASTAFFGLTPALQSTRIDLVPTMRGDVVRGAPPRRARHALIALQVGASTLLLICGGIFLRSALDAASSAPGIRTSDTLRVSLPDDEPRRAMLLRALITDPVVAAVAAEARTKRGTMSAPPSAGAPASSVVPVSYSAVSADYFDVLGIPLANGRGFAATERSAESRLAIVSEALARRMWTGGDAVGRLIRLDDTAYTVVGVVRDPARAAGGNRDVVREVYVPAAIDAPDAALLLRVRDTPEQARQALAERMATIDPAPIQILTVLTLTRMESYLLDVGSWVAAVLGALALALTVSGLFSVLSYLVEQQAREIGVRMALGAATANVMRMILRQSARPVAIGLAAGGGLAAAVAIVLMTTPIAAEIGDGIDVLDPVAYLGGVAIIVASCALAVSVPARRAARIDPMTTLRND